MKTVKIDADSASILTTAFAQRRISEALGAGDLAAPPGSAPLVGLLGTVELSEYSIEGGDLYNTSYEVVVASCASRSLAQGYRVLAARLDGRDVDPATLPVQVLAAVHEGLAEGYASLRPKGSVPLADRLEAIASGKTVGGADHAALVEAVALLRRQVRPTASKDLGMEKELTIGLTSALQGLNPIRSIRLARESHPVLDALTEVEDGQEVVLSAEQSRTVMLMMLSAHGK